MIAVCVCMWTWFTCIWLKFRCINANCRLIHTEDYNSPTTRHQCNLCMWLSFILNVNECLLFTTKTSLWTRAQMNWFSNCWQWYYSIDNLWTMQRPVLDRKQQPNIYFIHIIIRWMWSWDDDQHDSFAYHLTNSYYHSIPSLYLSRRLWSTFPS